MHTTFVNRGSSAAASLMMTIAVLLPCRFLWPLRANFTADWYNHKWAIGYFGEYFRRHWALPEVFNSTQWGGIPAPIFYGNLAYLVLGLLGSVLTSGTVIRLLAILLFAAQYYCVARALQQLQTPRWFASAVACLVIWATYPLTNLFNRNALMEFLATALLVCSLSLAVPVMCAPSRP